MAPSVLTVSPPPPPQLLSPEKQAQILQGATVVFAREGYEGASMSHIARAAGVSKGTLYNYFDSKADLFAAYVKQECTDKLPVVFGATGTGQSPGEILTDIGRRMLEMMLSPAGVTVYRVVISEAEKFPNLARTFYESGPARAVAHLSGWLAEETRRGLLKVNDPDFAAEQFFALCQTRLCFRRKLSVSGDPSAEEIAKVVDTSVRMFLNTYSA